jgi:tetratricopeptide (TPR) repeat protein
VALLNQGKASEAVPQFEAALETLPLTTEPQYKAPAIRLNLGRALLQSSRFREAANHFGEAVRLDPANADAHYRWALALACEGGTNDAVQHYTKALSLRPGVDTSVALHELLAENYAKAGRFDQAIGSAGHALQLARAAGKSDLVERITARLTRYESGRSRSP